VKEKLYGTIREFTRRKSVHHGVHRGHRGERLEHFTTIWEREEISNLKIEIGNGLKIQS
jgi:hypothetical protein